MIEHGFVHVTHRQYFNTNENFRILVDAINVVKNDEQYTITFDNPRFADDAFGPEMELLTKVVVTKKLNEIKIGMKMLNDEIKFNLIKIKDEKYFLFEKIEDDNKNNPNLNNNSTLQEERKDHVLVNV